MAETASASAPPKGADVKRQGYKTGQDNIQIFGLDIHNPVFLISAVVIVSFVVITLLFQEGAASFFGWLRPTLTKNFDWFFVISANIFVVFSLVLAFSSLGRMKIGGADAKPDYSFAGWTAMLFAAGMGIGLMFFGVLEPVAHTLTPPLNVAPDDPDAARIGMAATVFHWGLHAWAIYAVVALSLAYFTYSRGLPLTLRSAFHPLLGDRVWGWPGHIIDTVAVFATLFGLATSLGIGADQIASGLTYLFGPITEAETTLQVVLILGITAVALGSVMAGMDAGVKRLSEINVMIAALLLLFVLLAGPTSYILSSFFTGIFDYFVYLPALSNPIGRTDTGFYHGWTTFYWAWWISWSPFVGMFIARISRGRTVREFVTCVLIAPTIVCALWMSVFGGSAIAQMTDGYDGVRETITNWTPELSLFAMLSQLPLSGLLSGIALLLVVVFFVTSSDSGSLVIDSITAGGKVDAPVAQRIFWCIFEGLVAATLLLGGGLVALQAATISTGLPFTLILLGMCYCLWKGLRQDQASAK